MQNFGLSPHGTEGPFNEPSGQEKPIFPTVTQLPDGGTRLGAVIGPILHVPEHLGSGLENVGVFGYTGSGKTYIMKAIALHTMLNGNLAWMFDEDDEFSCLVDAVPEPYKPVIITPKHLRINFFQPPNDLIKLVLWQEIIALLLRNETFIRDGARNLFKTSLSQLLKNRGTDCSCRYPSLTETLCYLQGLRLSGSEVCGKRWLESLVNRITMLCDTFEETASVTNSNMLESLANRSVIFRLHNMRKTPLQFLTKFLLMWLSKYRQDAANTKKLQTLFLDGQRFFRADKSRNDIGSSTLEDIFATGAKRGLRIVLSNQIVSHFKNHMLGNLECRIIMRLTNPSDIWHIQQSMGLSHAQTRSISQLKKREAIVSYGGYPMPFKIRIDDFLFPPKQEEVVLERNTQAFLSQVYWYEDSGLEGSVELPEIITGETLKVFIRIAEVVETVEERYDELQMDRGSEVLARKVLEAKGYIVQEEIIVGNKTRFYKLTPKGTEWAKSQGIKVSHFESGPIHEYLLDQIEQKIGALNPQYKFQRKSDIGQEHGIHPDLLLIHPRVYRIIIEIVCCNIDRKAKTLVKERSIAGVKVVIAIVPNRHVKKVLQCALKRCQINETDANLASLVILDAGECLSPKFDWVSIFERP